MGKQTTTRRVSIDVGNVDVSSPNIRKGVGRAALVDTPYGNVIAFEPGKLPGEFGDLSMKGTLMGLASNPRVTRTKMEADIEPIPSDQIAAREKIIECLKRAGFNEPFDSL
jgi:hypothetical protein